MTPMKRFTVAIAIVGSLALTAGAKGPTAEDFAKIAAAAPDKAAAAGGQAMALCSAGMVAR